VISVLLWLAAASALPAAWLVAHFADLVQTPVPTAIVSGGDLRGRFLLSWATEVAQLDIRARSRSILALVAVFPSTRSTSTSRGAPARTRRTPRTRPPT
jgi:hypothetical protein